MISYQPDRVSIIAEISKIIASSAGLNQTLQSIVAFLGERFSLDVCSLYLFQSETEELLLTATVGLDPQSIGHIHMPVSEGLTGLVIQEERPILIKDPETHPRFKYFQESGEEKFHTFLGLPLIYQQEKLGVLVIQTTDPLGLTDYDIPFFETIASQMAALSAYTGLVSDLTKNRIQESSEPLAVQTRNGEQSDKGLTRGTPVSPGFGQGTAHFMEASLGLEDISPQWAKDTDHELTRLQQALNQAIQEVESFLNNLDLLAEKDRAIANLQLMFLQDSSFSESISSFIKQGCSAEYALKNAVIKSMDKLSQADQPYFRDRVQDIEETGKLLLNVLKGLPLKSGIELEEDTILIASDLSPVQVLSLKQKHLKAIVLSQGGQTSHATILTKSLGIPTVIRAKHIVNSVSPKDFLIVDGNSGLIFHNPSQDIKAEYTRLEREKETLQQDLLARSMHPAKTRDQKLISVGANIGLLSDLEMVSSSGADYIGLYRSEFPFLARSDFPSEEEQYQIYAQIVQKMKGKEVTIRTLDVGGDKFLPYLQFGREDNPALGWRSIRVSLEQKDKFRSQIRAILRASALGPVRCMCPMVTSLKEIHAIRALLEEEKTELSKKHIVFNQELPFGIMVEVPGTVRILDQLLPWLDFISLGTNDLIQYTLAVDRNNPKVESLYSPFHPAVIRLIQDALELAKTRSVPVTICGETAANPAAVYLLLGLGAEHLSLNPGGIPLIKDFLRHSSFKEARKIASLAMRGDDTEKIQSLLVDQVKDFLPS
jgi:phosphotransferase system enzyme I (PtsP)